MGIEPSSFGREAEALVLNDTRYHSTINGYYIFTAHLVTTVW